jgi:NTP pyrophosphatase (non-canonical NTP hydrolase)
MSDDRSAEEMAEDIRELEEIFEDVGAETQRQKRLKSAGKFEHTPEEVTTLEALPMLMEEVGEVARSLCESRLDRYSELLQVAAIAVRMAQRVRRQIEGHLPEGEER